MADSEYILEMKNIVKTFPGVQALRGVDLKVRPGEIHALLGENGAGKSTLMKCIIGIHSPTSGQIFFNGKELGHYNPAEALKMGISMIHQELNPVLHRPIMENLWLGREPRNKLGLINHKKMAEMTSEVLEEIYMMEDPRTLMSELTVAKMQMCEIGKAISYNSKLILMDEPTSALTNREVDQLFVIMRKLKEKGTSMIYISHKLDEIYKIADIISVYRDGEYIGTGTPEELKVDKLINMMVGRDVKDQFPKEVCPIGEVKLEVKNLSHKKYFTDVSFTLRRGEILGVAGLIGAGRSEVIETIFGVRQKSGGQILVDGKDVNIRRVDDAKKAGMAFITEDRRNSGIFPMLDIQLNMVIGSIPQFLNKTGFLSEKRMRVMCDEYVQKVQIKTPGLGQLIQNLSGGNQQKVLVARWLMTNPDILLFDEPTRGIDVLTKAEIHRLITRLAGEGKSIIMVSSELPEVMGMSDRIMIMHQGKVTGIIDNRPDLTQEELMAYATNTMEDYQKQQGVQK
ncbi:sugar ABC transporter ATP-binding protein [Treponema primitia]|uniref:sugar ABC transporter ATP-binding protein n=1 Tax=Treponema primitia TaxID=88058 RepID=UPI0002554EFF|nr:sugar ABC transporter ATP-binding protein [Treponema primitia]